MFSVREIRLSVGLTQSELAGRLGVAQSIVSRWETGTLPIGKRTELAIEAIAAQANVSTPPSSTRSNATDVAADSGEGADGSVADHASGDTTDPDVLSAGNDADGSRQAVANA